MTMSKETAEALNSLLQSSFDANAIVDNCAYSLAYNDYNNIEPIVHKAFAHKFPEFADIISDLMIRSNARPVRLGLADHLENYGDDLVGLFKVINDMCEKYRNTIISCIEVADMNSDYEAKIQLEEFLVQVEPYRKQSEVWYKLAQRYQGHYMDFDVHFAELTTVIGA